MEGLDQLIVPVLTQMGFGGAIGFLVGYAIKKLLKVLAIIAGLIFLMLLYLEYSGVIEVKYEKLYEWTSNIMQTLGTKLTGLETHIVSHLPFASSFIVGLVIGFKKG
ncbi:MAG: hypothetical protein DRN15_06895 [Thermoprotei archaeon]|nr:MAG: hypothetical protein DRN15_06895 [Thermoprotei archaeon]